ncbi:hypothetical protein D5F01_LYC15052 [Larimichthys crocea]|uniref:Uncharacterized protein n=1 Tax=Larimichthys crocea TaxID=215358 RepID=A0A6G0I6M6_LARCR|nr:hypothetical protein D5F01_LYC15052 [Larimichthys crocea]
MTTLLIKLDSVFLKEEKDRQYKTHMEYDRITKDSSVSMVDYIVEFERRYNRIHQFKMELLDVVLAFKLLDTAGLNVKDKQLALTACPSLLFDNMKAALKKTFGDVMPQRGGNGPRLSRDATDAAYYTKFTGRRENNHSLFDAVKSTKSVTEKRLRLKISSIKELINSGTIQRIMWSTTKEQLADCLTKKQTSLITLLRALSEGVWQLKS